MCTYLYDFDSYLPYLQAAEQLYGTMVKRFNFNKEIWINFGMFLMKNKKQDSARRLMQRSFKSLDQKHRKLSFM